MLKRSFLSGVNSLLNAILRAKAQLHEKCFFANEMNIVFAMCRRPDYHDFLSFV